MSEGRMARPFHQLFAPDHEERLWNANSTQEKLHELVASLDGPFLAIVEAPTGIGKTEAFAYVYATRFASNSNGTDGMYVALPTMATTNAMFPRIRNFLKNLVGEGDTTLHLAQSEASLNPLLRAMQANGANGKEGLRESVSTYDWFSGRKRALLAQFSVGTVDQIMMAAMATRHQFVRMFGLYGKTIVIDEIHAYDTYMMDIICVLLAWLRRIGSPVILLSATLPESMRADLIAAYSEQKIDKDSLANGPNITVWSEDSIRSELIKDINPRTVRFQLCQHEDTDEDLVDHAVRATVTAIETGGCIACVMNTVKDAQAVATALCSALREDVPVIIAHSRFTRRDRREWEARVINLFGNDRTNRPDRAVVVGTQVLEQSLDVDFDFMVSDLAPIDLLIQRAGRVHRHWHKTPSAERAHTEPTLVVIVPSLERFEPRPAVRGIYKSTVLARTAFVLAEHGDAVVLPGDETRLINAVYEQEVPASLPTTIAERLAEWDQEDLGSEARDRVQASRIALNSPAFFDYEPDLSELAGQFAEVDDELVRTRLGAESIDVVIITDDVQMDELDAHIDNTVRVSVAALRKTLRGVPRPSAWERHWFLNRAVPLRLDEGKVLIDGVEVSYDSQFGLQYKNL